MSVRVFHEVPSGLVDGINNTFVLSSISETGTVRVFYRGQALDTASFTIASDKKTIILGFTPSAAQLGEGNIIEVDYNKASIIWSELS